MCPLPLITGLMRKMALIAVIFAVSGFLLYLVEVIFWATGVIASIPDYLLGSIALLVLANIILDRELVRDNQPGKYFSECIRCASLSNNICPSCGFVICRNCFQPHMNGHLLEKNPSN